MPAFPRFAERALYRTAKTAYIPRQRKSNAAGRGMHMDTRVAIVGIIVENLDSVGKLNEILHSYGQYIIGRMGIPYREKSVHVISIAMDAPQDVISALSGKIGKLSGVTTKAAYSHVRSRPPGDDF